MGIRTQDALYGEVARHCLAQGLLAPGQGVLAAVSSGADSSALALVLAGARAHGLPLRLELAHLDHGWRGAREAAADLEGVRALAARLGLVLHTASASGAEALGEEAARRWRYRELERIAREQGLGAVATGHHAGDQAETLLMRLLRGSGPVGLAGIPARRRLGSAGRVVVRPLLKVQPDRLRALLVAECISWREDPSNTDERYERVRSRVRLAAHRNQPMAVRSLLEISLNMGERVRHHQHRLSALLAHSLRHFERARAVRVEREALLNETAIHVGIALKEMGYWIHAERDGTFLTRRHVALVMEGLRGEGVVHLPRGLAFHVRGKSAWLYARVHQPVASRLLVEAAEPPATAQAAWDFPSATSPVALLDAQVLGRAPRLRVLEPGDVFEPLGRGPQGRTRVGVWLQNQGIPAFVRRHTEVLEGHSGVAWVVGHRVDQRHAVSRQSTRVVRVHALAGDPAEVLS